MYYRPPTKERLKAGGQTRTPDRLITKQIFHYPTVYLVGVFRAFCRVFTRGAVSFCLCQQYGFRQLKQV